MADADFESSLRTLKNVKELIAFAEHTTVKASQPEEQRAKLPVITDAGETGSHEASQRSPRPLYVDIHLPPDHVDFVLEAAPSPRVGQAWLAGRAVPGVSRRLKLCQHGDYVDDERAGLQALYEEGRKFWERG